SATFSHIVLTELSRFVGTPVGAAWYRARMAFLGSLLSVARQGRLHLGGWLVASALVALLPTSCLTPDFDFGERGIGEGGNGQTVVAHCQNRRVDADESDIDCGGIDCAPCALGRSC